MSVLGKVISNDGDLAVIVVPRTEPLRVHRYRETEDYFKSQWSVGKEVTVED